MILLIIIIIVVFVYRFIIIFTEITEAGERKDKN